MSLLEPSSSSATARAFVAGSDANYLGVAPNATLAGYRVLDCSAMLEEDDLIAGWVKAYQDGAQIIVSSAGWPGAAWATRPAAAVVSRIVDSGVPCIVGLGNENNSGLFNTLNPSSGRGVTSVNAFARASGAIDGHVTVAPIPSASGLPTRPESKSPTISILWRRKLSTPS